MAKTGHRTDHPASCPACLTHAATNAMFGRTPDEHMAIHLDLYVARHNRARKAAARKVRRTTG